MTIFTRQQICQYLAEKMIEMTPAFELRKLKVSESVSDEKRQYYLDLYHVHFNEAFEYIDPPRPYLSYPVPSLEMDCSLERLTPDEEYYLYKLFNVKNLNNLIESAEKFKGYYKLFIESVNKPDWDLVRVFAKDSLDNYKERQKEYERLLDGGLNARINRGDVIKLDEDEYELKKNKSISHDPFLPGSVYERVVWYESIGNEIAIYRQQNNKTINDIETKKFSLQINEILKEALQSGGLPVYRLPAFRPIEYVSYPPNTDDVIYWGDVKRLLESKTRLSLPEKPVFMRCWPEIERDINTKTSTVEIEENGSKNTQIEPNQTSSNKPKVKKIKVTAAFSKFYALRATEISVVMMENKTAKMIIKKEQIVVHPEDLNLKPSVQGWKMLERAAINSGDLTSGLKGLNKTNDREKEKRKIKTTVSRLRSKLINSMGLIDDPIPNMENGSSYRFSFKTMTHEMVSGGNVSKGDDAMQHLNHEEYDDNEQYNEKESWDGD